MPDNATRGDSVRLYLTGAGSDGGAQIDPDASLGNYRSSTAAQYFDVNITNPISNITVDFVSGAHTEGTGSLRAVTGDTLAWTPPGGSEGSPVSIADGETKIIEGSGSPAEFVRVTRTSATSLSGNASLGLTFTYNNLVAFDNVSSAEATAGDIEYRAGMFKNDSVANVDNLKAYVATLGTQQVSGSVQLPASGAGSVTLSVGNFNDWPDSGWCRIEDSGGSLREIVYYESRTSTTLNVLAGGRAQLGTSAQAGAATDKIYAVPGIRLGIEAPSSDAIQTIANENTAPTSITWSTAITSSNGLSIGTLTPGSMYGLWLERAIPAGATSEANVQQKIGWSFDAA